MLHIALIGCGAIGSGVLELISRDTRLVVDQVVVPDALDPKALEILKQYAPTARLTHILELNPTRPDLVVECAGHGAIEAHVLPALAAGIPAVLASVGALSENGLVERLEAAAQKGNTQVQLLSGAIGAIDALAAAKIGGLEKVVYVGRKPPLAWLGTPAEQNFALGRITEPTLIFSGSAREAAHVFTKNANVAATVALASLGLDQVQVELYADPGIKGNQHNIKASGAFGNLELTLEGRPLAANPKTSALTVYSVVRAITNSVRPLII